LNLRGGKAVAVTFCNRGLEAVPPPPVVFVSVADKMVTEEVLVSVADKGLTGR
jgi:hypothetical protein